MKNKILAFLASICFIMVVMITCIDYWSVNKDFYKEEYDKYDNAQVIGVSDEDLYDITDVLLDYTTGNRNDLVVEKEVNGQLREIFNDKEKLHMVDVQNLYGNAIKVRNVFFVMLIILLALMKFDLKNAFSSYKSAFLMMMTFLAVITVYALIDFDTFWINFHYIFFTNDLFFLNPNTDILIMMVPGGFFLDLVMRIILSIAIILGLMFGCLKMIGED